MRTYEIMTIAKGSKGEDSAKELSQQITKIITDLGGEILEGDYWGRRKFAYKIKSETEGFYDLKTFKLPELKILSLRTKLNIVENLVRYLIIAKEDIQNVSKKRK
ncbi:30S ribosomal protein S6 [Patescibacteria group bacterium]